MEAINVRWNIQRKANDDTFVKAFPYVKQQRFVDRNKSTQKKGAIFRITQYFFSANRECKFRFERVGDAETSLSFALFFTSIS